MKKKISLLILLSLCGILFIIFLQGMSLAIANRKNHFIRLIPPHRLAFTKKVNLKSNAFYFAGGYDSVVILGASSKYNYLVFANLQLSDTFHKVINVPFYDSVNYDKLNVEIDYPEIRFVDGVGKNVIVGSIKQSRFHLKKLPYSFAQNICLPSSSSMIYQSFRIDSNELFLNKRNFLYDSGRVVSIPLSAKHDGLFPGDGSIHYDQKRKNIVYVYRYTNEVAVFDTNLNKIASISTIDTNSLAKVKSAYIASKDQITMAAPPVIVNAFSSIDGDNLYVKSELIADNENQEDFKSSEPIDVYSLSKGNYLFSFYLPITDGKRSREFIVVNNNVLVLSQNELLSYRLFPLP